MRRILAVAVLALSLGTLAAAQAPAPGPGPEYQQLNSLLGVWKGGGEMKDTPISAAGKFEGTVTCSKFPGGRNVVCNVEAQIGKSPYRELAVFGYDPDAKRYTWYDIDSTGMDALGHGSFEALTWTFYFDLKSDGKPAKLRVTIKELGPSRLQNIAEVSVAGGPWLLMQSLTMDKAK